MLTLSFATGFQNPRKIAVVLSGGWIVGFPGDAVHHMSEKSHGSGKKVRARSPLIHKAKKEIPPHGEKRTVVCWARTTWSGSESSAGFTTHESPRAHLCMRELFFLMLDQLRQVQDGPSTMLLNERDFMLVDGLQNGVLDFCFLV
jgi:hypothetical protein